MRALGPSLALVVAALVLLAGCVATPSTPSDGSNPTPTPTSDDDRNAWSPSHHDVYVFDHAGLDSPAIEGGITYAIDGNYSTRYYVTTIDTAEEADSRFNHSVLGREADAFVANTSFANASLVVIQHFPASSVPDYRVESVQRDGATLDVRVNDSSWGGTADVTVETVLLRVRGSAPERVQVTTEEGHTFDTSTGVVTIPPDPTPTPDPSEQLPYASAVEAENVEDALGIRLVNEVNDTVGYELAMTYHEVPECRDATPPCGQPTRTMDVLERAEKLPAGQSAELEDLVRRTGNYTVEISASFPAASGSRETVTESITWRIDENASDLVVSFEGGDVAVARE